MIYIAHIPIDQRHTFTHLASAVLKAEGLGLMQRIHGARVTFEAINVMFTVVDGRPVAFQNWQFGKAEKVPTKDLVVACFQIREDLRYRYNSAVAGMIHAWKASVAHLEQVAKLNDLPDSLAPVVAGVDASVTRLTGFDAEALTAMREATEAGRGFIDDTWSCDPGGMPLIESWIQKMHDCRINLNQI